MNKVEVLKYKVIQNPEQYNNYCEILEALLDGKNQTKQIEDEIDLLTVLIEKYDEEYTSLSDLDPVQLLHSFMDEHNMTATDLAGKLGVGKSYISEILNYKKSFSKDIIRGLSELFKVRQEAFNREYSLHTLSVLDAGIAQHTTKNQSNPIIPGKPRFKIFKKAKKEQANKRPKQKVLPRVKARD